MATLRHNSAKRRSLPHVSSLTPSSITRKSLPVISDRLSTMDNGVIPEQCASPNTLHVFAKDYDGVHSTSVFQLRKRPFMVQWTLPVNDKESTDIESNNESHPEHGTPAVMGSNSLNHVMTTTRGSQSPSARSNTMHCVDDSSDTNGTTPDFQVKKRQSVVTFLLPVNENTEVKPNCESHPESRGSTSGDCPSSIAERRGSDSVKHTLTVKGAVSSGELSTLKIENSARMFTRRRSSAFGAALPKQRAMSLVTQSLTDTTVSLPRRMSFPARRKSLRGSTSPPRSNAPSPTRRTSDIHKAIAEKTDKQLYGNWKPPVSPQNAVRRGSNTIMTLSARIHRTLSLTREKSMLPKRNTKKWEAAQTTVYKMDCPDIPLKVRKGSLENIVMRLNTPTASSKARTSQFRRVSLTPGTSSGMKASTLSQKRNDSFRFKGRKRMTANCMDDLVARLSENKNKLYKPRNLCAGM
jgi:hypothetical protein